MKINQEKIMLYAKSLLFEPNKDEMHHLIEEFEDILEQMEIVDEIDTKGVAISSFPNLNNKTYLREDIVIDVKNSEAMTSNANDQYDNYIMVEHNDK